jgi:hypothetical protein
MSKNISNKFGKIYFETIVINIKNTFNYLNK